MWSPSKKQKLNPEEEKQCLEFNGEERSQCLTCSKETPKEDEELNQHMADAQENAQLPENLNQMNLTSEALETQEK